MGKRTGRFVRRAFVACLLALASLCLCGAVFAAEYPRKVAVSPFTTITKEDIQPTVSVLPRLLMSRLMALAGADVALLPAAEKSPVEQARGAGMAILLQGTVAKLGKGYSIDVTATEVESGKLAGAFFAAAATEDEIIPQLGVLSGEVVEKLFGIKTSARMVPAPAATVPSHSAATAPSGAPILPPSAPSASAGGSGAPAVPSTATGSAAETVSDGKWTPSSIKRVSRSDKISGELHGVVAGNVDEDGNGEVFAFADRIIYIYRIKNNELMPYTRITTGLPSHILNVEAIDLDGDGKKEILVSGLDGDSMESTVLKRKGELYEPVARRIPYFLVVLPDWQGKTVTVGQRQGSDTAFEGKLYTMTWNGNTLTEGAPLSADIRMAPLSSGIPSLSSARFGGEWQLIYTDQDSHLRILDASGKTEYRTGGSYGAATDNFDYGLYLPRLGRSKFSLKKAARVSPGGEGSPLLVIPKTNAGLVNFSALQESKSVVILQWSEGELVERANSGEGDYTYTGADFFSPSRMRKGGKVIASALEKSGIAKGGVSRLVLFTVQ